MKKIIYLVVIVLVLFGVYTLRQKSFEGDNLNPPSNLDDSGNNQDDTSSPTPPTPSSPNPNPTSIKSGLPVFPGAVGFGTKTKGGRGGKVIEVTNLNDDGPGSLREALTTKGPRIVVFKVGGVIKIKESLYINDPYITIAGQTAPGDGITIRDASFVVFSHDVLIQHIRVRPGNEGSGDPQNNDGFSILGKKYGGDTYNVVLDHVSISWAEDESISTIGGLRDVTISNSIISEALNESRHQKGSHSTAILFDDTDGFTAIGNLIAHNSFRNPYVTNNQYKSNMIGEVVNNVIYNWGELATESVNASPDTSTININIVGNVYKFGPSTVGKWPIVVGQEGFPKIHLRDNLASDFTPILTPEIIKEKNLATGDYLILGGNDVVVNKTVVDQKIKSTVFDTPAVKSALSSSLVFEKVLANVGATKPKRDPVDTRVVSETRNRTGKVIDDPENDVGGYPTVKNGTPYKDSDHDGMSDEWESSQGLNPNNSSDGNSDKDGDGYTNVEEFLFSLL